MKALAVVVLAVVTLVASSAGTETLRWARASDALTLDPHSFTDGPTHTLRHQIYEPLMIRSSIGAFQPALATHWSPKRGEPNVWVFYLREDVRFHDGSDFTAEDVVFSIERSKQPNSDVKEVTSSIVDVRAVGDYEVEIVTDGPNPILPSNLTNLFIMDKTWSEKHDTSQVQDYKNGEITYATLHANGTGPYVLKSREQNVKTVMTRNEDYWGFGTFPVDVNEIVFIPIADPLERVKALLSGEVNFLQDMPVQYMDRVASEDGITIKRAPQNRIIFLGLNQGAEDLASDNLDGVNPLADVRVRKAMSLAIDRHEIKREIMRGQSQPAGMIAAPFVNGWDLALERETKTDVSRAKDLMKQAGYKQGFSIQLDCPNNRYVNDEAICEAVVEMLAEIGIAVDLSAQSKAQHFPLITEGKTDFYLLGWAVPTHDSEYIFNFLVHGRESSLGTWNATGYADASINRLIKSLASNTDLDARDADIAKIWQTVQDQQIYIPIHHQVLSWAMSDMFEIEVDHEDQPKVKYFVKN